MKENTETISKERFKQAVRKMLDDRPHYNAVYEPRVDSHYARSQTGLITPDGTERMYHRIYLPRVRFVGNPLTEVIGLIQGTPAVRLDRVYINPSPTLDCPDRWLLSIMTIERREQS